MLAQIRVGSALISLTIFVIAGFAGLAIKTRQRIGPWFAESHNVFRLVLATTGVTLWVLAALGDQRRNLGRRSTENLDKVLID
ncbi:MAG: hypothetical protein AAFW97_12480 [Pseudomonadota bacterium]